MAKGKVAMRCECGFLSSSIMLLFPFSVPYYGYDISRSHEQDVDALADTSETFLSLEV